MGGNIAQQNVLKVFLSPDAGTNSSAGLREYEDVKIELSVFKVRMKHQPTAAQSEYSVYNVSSKLRKNGTKDHVVLNAQFFY